MAAKASPRSRTLTAAPTTGPMARPSSWAAKMRDTARPRSAWSKSDATADSDATSMAPAAAPWTARVSVNHGAVTGKRKVMLAMP